MFPMHGGFMGRGAQGGLPYTPPSEILNTIHSAWSIRKVVTAYTGPCVKVRRSTDSALLDIDFDVNGYIDTAALLAFAGVGISLLIDTWYDQSGNGYNLTSSGPNQPFIVTANVLNVSNSLVALTFNESRVNPHLLQDVGAGNIARYNFLHNGDDSTIFGVATYGNIASPADLQILLSTTEIANGAVGFNIFVDDRAPGNSDRFTSLVYQGGNFTYASDNREQDSIFPQQQSILYAFTDADNATAANRSVLAVNGNAVIQNNIETRAPSTANQSNALQLGRRGNFSLKGSIQEVIICEGDESANRTTLRDNQNLYYSTF